MGLSVEVSVSAAAVFAQGLLSFFSPCVLPLLPLYIGYLSGGPAREEDDTPGRKRGRTMLNTFFFVVGISAAFFLLGLGMSAIGRFFGENRLLLARIGGIIVLLFGLYQLGLFKESAVLNTERRLPLRLDKLAMSPWTALIMGFVFSFAWTPCVGPALSGVLLMAASASSSAVGFLLIGVYTLGFVIPFLAVGLFTTTLLDLFSRHRNVVRYTAKAGGVLLVFMGILMITGAMNGLSGRLSVLSRDEAAAPETTAVTEATPEPTAMPRSAPNAYVTETAPAETHVPTPTPEPEPTPDEDVFPAIDFTLYDQYGALHTLADYRGKVIFLNFWATWCPPRRSEMPDIQALYEKYGDDSDVAIVGVAFPGFSGEEDADGVAAFLDENGYRYPVLMDTEAALLQAYGISAYPTTFMIDVNGNIYGYVTGAISQEIMEDIIQQTREASGLN